MALNITTAVIGSGCNAATASPSLAQWDKGQILQISGVELPETYKVEFSNGDTLEAIPAIGTAEGVEIPDKLLYSSSPIRAYIVLSEAEGERNTEYWVTIYVKPREIPEDIEPDPAQQDVIDDLIAQLNTGVGKADAAADAAEASAGEAEAASQAVQDLGVRAETAASGAPAAVQKIVDAETGAVTLVFFLPQGEAGFSPVVTVTTITGGHRVTVTDADGAHSFDVMDGRSVTGVTMGADYKLTFTFSDGTTWTTPTSIRGETGATPRLTIGTVSTLDPGQGATAEITGTPEDPVLNFGIPKGQAGASDAGGVTYDPTETYQSGTAGAALNDLSRQISDLTDTVSTTQIINSASGAIASFDDGADGQPIRKLVAQIEPVQDLHGYDSPWPAGGGVNMLDDAYSASYTNELTLTEGTYYAQAWVLQNPSQHATNPALLIDGEWTNITPPYSGDGISIAGTSFGWLYNNATQTITVDAGKTFTIRYNRNDAAMQTRRLTFSKTQLSAFSPYSNICPISGHTGAEIERRGKNLFDKSTGIQLEPKNLRIARTQGKGVPFKLRGGVTYTFSCNSNTPAYIYINFPYSTTTIAQSGAKVTSFTYTPADDIEVSLNFCWDTDRPSDATDFMIEVGSIAHDYEPYTGNQISVNWEDEAGTVYGGTLTINPDRTGTLVVDRVIYQTGWDLPTNVDNKDRWSMGQFLPNVLSSLIGKMWDIPADTTISNNLAYKKEASASSNDTTYSIYGHTSRVEWRIRIPNTYTASEAQAIANASTICYPINPITYQLTESEISGILETLYGTNNIWSSTGDTEVTYPADTKLYIDGKIAEAIAALGT